MAFKLAKDQRHDFQAAAGIDVIIGVQAPSTTLKAAFYNGKDLPLAVDGTVSFTPLQGTFFLTVAVAPPFPPEAWNVIEVDGANTQILKPEDSDMQVDNLIIVGH